jgi:tRNA-specific 2-thiouridylase
MPKDKVVVAMSGGVDSSVAACLLHEAGCQVIGLFMRVGAWGSPNTADPERAHKQGCCSATDAADARRVAHRLGIPFYVLNFREEFDRLQDYFAGEYARGRTPNPCVLCNSQFKLGRLWDYADVVGAEFVATGHYARIDCHHGRPVLLRGKDHSKDQSYVLFDLPAETLQRILLPIGALTKQEVREHARRLGLPVAEKRDSQEICFVPDGDYQRVVRARRPDAFRPGPLVNENGERIGTHGGVAGFTIGQRRGLGVAVGAPRYVTHIDAESDTVMVGPRDGLMAEGLIARRCNWLLDPPDKPTRAHIKIRHQHRPAAGEIRLEDDAVLARFDQPQLAVTPGQAAVFYDGDAVLGGGWIERALPVGRGE